MKQNSLVMDRKPLDGSPAFAGAPAIVRPHMARENDAFGEKVALVEDTETGEVTEYIVLTSGRADANAGRISEQSPIGAALLLSRVGQIVEVAVPDGIVRLRVLNIAATRAA